jgi:2-dehydropantoate 2-reductase
MQNGSTYPRQVFVVGAGAIGASVGALLFEAGVDCVLVVRDGEHGRALVDRGVDLRFPKARRTVRVPTATTTTATPDDLVLLATMGHETQAALEGVDPRVTVASFQNGVTPLDAIRRRGHDTLAAMVYVPAERRGPGLIALPAAPVPGTVLVGAWPRGEGRFGPWVAARLRTAGFRAEVDGDIGPWVRAKLLVNLGGIVAALCDDPPADVIAAAQDEARAVFRRTGERFEDVSALVARVGELQTEAVEGRERVGGSTRSALARGDRLETAYLHCTIIKAGRDASIPTPRERAPCSSRRRGRRQTLGAWRDERRGASTSGVRHRVEGRSAVASARTGFRNSHPVLDLIFEDDRIDVHSVGAPTICGRTLAAVRLCAQHKQWQRPAVAKSISSS